MKISIPSFSSAALAIIAGCVLSAGCNMSFTMVDGYRFDRTGETAEHSEEGSFSEGIRQIKIDNRFGNVKVSTATGEPGWTWDAKVWGETQELADQFIDELSMEVQTNGDTQTWTVVLPEKSPDLNGVESNLTLNVPSDVSVKLANRHGHVQIRNIASAVELENAHGDVELKSLTGDVVIVNAHGNLIADQIAAGDFKNSHGNTTIRETTADISIKSSHGRVTAEQIQGTLEFDGSHGDLIANAAGGVTAKNSHGASRISSSGESIQIASSHGDIQLTMYSDSFKSIDLETSHSSIEVMLPASSSPSIAMDTTHGKMSSEIESRPNSDQRVRLKNRHGNITVRKSQGIAEAAE